MKKVMIIAAALVALAMPSVIFASNANATPPPTSTPATVTADGDGDPSGWVPVMLPTKQQAVSIYVGEKVMWPKLRNVNGKQYTIKSSNPKAVTEYDDPTHYPTVEGIKAGKSTVTVKDKDGKTVVKLVITVKKL